MKHLFFPKATALLLLMLLPLAALSSCAEAYYRYDYDLSDYVTLCDYKGVAAKTFTYTVTNEDVEAQILLCLSEYSDIETVERPAQAMDIVYINYTSYIDGEDAPHASYDTVELVLGTKTFIDGFEDAVIGHSANDKFDIELTFPDPYPADPDLSGLGVRFEVEIIEVCEQTLPNYDVDFVKQYYGYDSIEAFEDGVYDSIVRSYEDMLLKYKISQVWAYIMENSTVKRIPTTEYDAFYKSQLEYYTSLASEEGLSLSKYAKTVLGYESDADFYTQLQHDCEDWVFEEMVLYYIARKENIRISDKEYESGALDYANYYDLKTVEELEQFFDHDDIKENLLFDKVLTFLADNSRVE